eukprot:m.590662 g.590662  ORF g.590662 m.590662 type:complete len:121 (+) comp22377_c0_seq22:304-666(+)
MASSTRINDDLISPTVEWGDICTGETGKQLLRRRKTIVPLGNLGIPVFSRGIKTSDIVELFGSDGSGKTELAMHATVTCVIPKQYGGVGAEVLWLDMDYKFSVHRLAQVNNVNFRSLIGF